MLENKANTIALQPIIAFLFCFHIQVANTKNKNILKNKNNLDTLNNLQPFITLIPRKSKP